MKKVINILRDFRRKHFGLRRVIIALLVAAPPIAIGSWLLKFEVSDLGLDPVWAYRANWPVITFLCFVLNRIFTFSDRKNSTKKGYREFKWVVISLLHSVMNQYLYPKFVHAGVNYQLANVSLLALSPITFTIQSMWTFRKEKEKEAD